MADDAHRNSRGNKLAGVTTDASLVSRESRRRGIVIALVTRGACKRGMALAAVLENGVVELRALRQGDTQPSVQPLCPLSLCREC
jgi:hypothetical protein